MTNTIMKFQLKGLTCAHCSAKIEQELKGITSVKNPGINLVKQELSLEAEEAKREEIAKTVEKIVHSFEPDVAVKPLWKDGNAVPAEEEEEENPKKIFIRFAVGIALFLCAVLWKGEGVKTALFLISYTVFGYDVLLRAAKNIMKGKVFDENFLMAIATIGAIAIGEMAEAVFVMLFYQVGEAFQDMAVGRSRKSIRSLMEFRPDVAYVEKNGRVAEMIPEEVEVGDIIIVKPGEKIPLDGIVIEGVGYLDTSALTGESIPRQVGPGQRALSGSINQSGLLKIKVEKEFAQSTASKILELVESAADKKSETEQFITRFARIYTPAVVLAAAALGFLVPLFAGNFSMWFGRALLFLVISCPCALVLSVPLGFFSGIGAAAKKGILVKGSNYLQALSKLNTVVFDKTGTLTKGIFGVSQVTCANQFDESKLLYLASAAESLSHHPIAKAVVRYADAMQIPYKQAGVDHVSEAGGRGLSVTVDGKKVLAGSKRLMEEHKISYTGYEGDGSVVYIACDGIFAGYLIVQDTLKDDTKAAISQLKALGIKNIIMLTGDLKTAAEKTAKELGITKYYGELLPQGKMEALEEILKEKASGKVAFAGDGINDAPVLARADVGIAMGGIGTDAAIEAADVVIMNDSLSNICAGITIARNTERIVGQNIAFALLVKALVLILGAAGFASMWMAVFADVGVAVLAILNSMRRKI